MGINKSAIKLLFKEKKRSFKGKVLTLGKQDIILSKKNCLELKKYSNLACFDLKVKITDEILFKALGFDEVKSLDYSEYENADYIVDLNANEIPLYLHNSFDVIIDGGTTEHIFHIPNVLKNIYLMLKIGGRVIHLSPSSNHIDHGFYMFSPTLFWDFYKTNNFEIKDFKIIKHSSFPTSSWKTFNYEAGKLDPFSYGGMGGKMYAIYCVAEKLKNSTYNIIPQQSYYKNHAWKEKKYYRSKSILKKIVKKCPFFYFTALLFRRFLLKLSILKFNKKY